MPVAARRRHHRVEPRRACMQRVEGNRFIGEV